MGAYCSVYNDTQDDMYIKYGANMAALQWATIAASIAATLVSFGAAGGTLVVSATTAGVTGGLTTAGMLIASKVLDDEMKNNGYSKIAPGGKYTSEKLSLSLFLQANIVLKGERGVRSGTLDCWSGATDNACIEYRASQASYSFNPLW